MTPEEVAVANTALAGSHPGEIIDWIYKRFDGEVCIASSGGRNSAILLFEVLRRYPNTEVVFVDTEVEDITSPADRKYVTELQQRLDFFLNKYYPRFFPSEEHRNILRSGTDDEKRAVLKLLKNEPLARAMREPHRKIVLFGVRELDSPERSTFPALARHPDGYWTGYPMLRWFEDSPEAYYRRNELPVHPDGLPAPRPFTCSLHQHLIGGS